VLGNKASEDSKAREAGDRVRDLLTLSPASRALIISSTHTRR